MFVHKYKIVILDGYSVNPGDITWEPIQALGDVTVYESTSPDETVAHIGDAEVVLTNKTEITKEILDACPGIRYIGVLATGYNVIDLKAAKERGIPVTNVPAYSTTTVAQFTFGLILELCHHIGLHDVSVKQGDWVKSTGFCYWKTPMIELVGKTLGIIGFGQIGRAVASIAPAFGMKVLVFTPHPKSEYASDNLKFVSLDEVLGQSDIVTLHCLLNKNTKGMMNKDTLAKMKKGAMLINVSRGPLVEETDLKESLESGHLAGAACDVISVEPMKADNPLLTAPNIILTPHMAWASVEARERLLNIAAANISGWMEGKAQNVVF
ncbi:MAG: D-2-hydroxyacid dehydrogenase [Brotaphodocola sp.]